MIVTGPDKGHIDIFVIFALKHFMSTHWNGLNGPIPVSTHKNALKKKKICVVKKFV